MSLDVSLHVPGNTPVQRKAILIREKGQMKEITRAEWDERYPDQVPIEATVTDTDEFGKKCVYSANITHNLGEMAREAGLYDPLWRPEKQGITLARWLIEPLRKGLALLKSDQPRFEKFNAPNGWGLYVNFVPFVQKYLEACEEFPDAEVSVSV